MSQSSRPLPSPKHFSQTASTCYEKSPQSWSNTSYSTLSMDTMQHQATPSTTRLSRCNSPDFPGRHDRGASRTASEISSVAQSSIFEDATAFGARSTVATPESSLPPGPLMLEPEPAGQIPRPSLSLIESDLEALYRAARAPHLTESRTSCSHASQKHAAWKDQPCSEPTTISRSSRTTEVLRCPCCFQPAPERKQREKHHPSRVSQEEDRFSFAEPPQRRTSRTSESLADQSSRRHSLETRLQENFEEGLVTTHSKQASQDTAVCQRSDRQGARRSHRVEKIEQAQPQWQEVQAIAQPGAKLRTLARQRRSLTQELRARLQHMEQHCCLLSDDYQRLAGLDTELHHVVQSLRKAFATEQEALSHRRSAVTGPAE